MEKEAVEEKTHVLQKAQTQDSGKPDAPSDDKQERVVHECDFCGAITRTWGEKEAVEEKTHVLQKARIVVLDAGHKYSLPLFDGSGWQKLTFMKRDGEGYPGNDGAYPGTNLQSVLRACIDRVVYLQGQIPCENNTAILSHLRHCLLELEQRAAERHGMNWRRISLMAASTDPMCSKCGHVRCHCAPSVSGGSPALR